MGALEILTIAIWTFLVSVGGGAVGLVLGNLRLPVLIALGSSASAAAGANVAISGLAAMTAAVAHLREGRFDLRLFAWMAPPSLIGAVGGGLLAGVLPERILQATIAVVILYGAFEVMRHRRPQGGDTARPDHLVLLVNAGLVGLFVGLLGGLVGLILGSLRLPALIRYLGVAPTYAVGTNAAVGVVVGAGGLIGHLPSGVDWEILAIGSAAAMPGAVLGARLTGRLPESRLLQAIAVILLLSGLALLGQALLG